MLLGQLLYDRSWQIIPVHVGLLSVFCKIRVYWNIHFHSFKYCLWLLLYYNDRAEWLQQRTHVPAKQKLYCLVPYRKSLLILTIDYHVVAIVDCVTFLLHFKVVISGIEEFYKMISILANLINNSFIVLIVCLLIILCSPYKLFISLARVTSRKNTNHFYLFSCLKELGKPSNTPSNINGNNEHLRLRTDLNTIASCFSIKYEKNHVGFFFTLWTIMW